MAADDNNPIKPLNRLSLKDLFKNGMKPTQKSFSELIDSTVNKVDDGFSKDMQNGLMLSPEGESSENLLSFYHKIDDLKPAWSIRLNQSDDQFGLSFIDGRTDESLLYLKQGGYLGIGTESPEFPLHVNGMAGLNGRLGTFAKGTVPADGKWHPILSELSGCQGFEVVARAAGAEKKGKYALMHALAMSTYGKSHNRIKKTQAWYGPWWNRLNLRWTGDLRNYSLEIKTRCNYGKDRTIAYNVSKIWEEPPTEATVPSKTPAK